MRISIVDTHRHMTAKRKEALCDFFREVKGLADDQAMEQVFFCDWYEKEYAVKWFEAIASVDGVIAGYLRCFRNPDVKEEWFIGDVHVRPDFRGRDIATKLYEKTIQTVKEYDAAERIISSVHKDNHKSIGLHKKMGFVDTTGPCIFANFYFDELETKYEKTLFQLFPVRDVDMAAKLVLPVWIEYQKAKHLFVDESNANESLRKAFEKKFQVIWCGNNLVGFQYEENHEFISYCKVCS